MANKRLGDDNSPLTSGMESTFNMGAGTGTSLWGGEYPSLLRLSLGLGVMPIKWERPRMWCQVAGGCRMMHTCC
jgi:hypothetical protein